MWLIYSDPYLLCKEEVCTIWSGHTQGRHLSASKQHGRALTSLGYPDRLLGAQALSMIPLNAFVLI